MKVIGMVAHRQHFGDDRGLGPFCTKHFGELTQVDGSGLPDRENTVAQPRHTQVAQLFVEKLYALQIMV
jgi:hypothetical protein